MARLVYAALLISMVSSAVSIATFLKVQDLQNVIYGPGLTTYNSSGQLPIPPISLDAAPVITVQQPPGNRLTDINSPLNASELYVINDAPNSYFQIAATMLLNGSIRNQISTGALHSSSLVVNGRSSVIYLGAISCIFCAENRWAMALALSRFGNFTQLFKGYSSLGDGDVPTIYWRPAEYNVSSGIDLGNFYQSQVINFLSIEYASPIKGGFQIQTLPYILHQVQLSGNQPYIQAVQLIYNANNFAGTPYTLWGGFVVPHADATILGNSSSTNTISQETHSQIIQQLSHPSDQFAWSEYAAADVYVALMCSSLHNSVQVCGLPAITQIENASNY